MPAVLPIASALFAADQVGAIVLPIMIYHMSQLLVCAYVSQKAGQAVQEQKPAGAMAGSITK
ncbi:bile acid:sodium symporter [uncultured Cohaesibacter sp.]|uniref:bile acid:sodium symporter n=1 Tax=uncultured Cohaesibacter sp. TaxID=1002546 RepID=UPI00374A44E3